MFVLLALLLSSANAGTPDLTVTFKVWSWKQASVDDKAREKLTEAAKDAGFRDVKEIDTSRVCSFLYCNVKATGKGVR